MTGIIRPRGSYVYTYDALNRLERVWDNAGKEAEYFYRMNHDGTWSDKRGAGKVGIGIKNPLVDAYRKEYDILIGYFY